MKCFDCGKPMFRTRAYDRNGKLVPAWACDWCRHIVAGRKPKKRANKRQQHILVDDKEP